MIVPGRSLVSAGTGLQYTAVSRAVCDTSLKSWLVCEGLVVVLSEMKVQMAQTVGSLSLSLSLSLVLSCSLSLALSLSLSLSLSIQFRKLYWHDKNIHFVLSKH